MGERRGRFCRLESAFCDRRTRFCLYFTGGGKSVEVPPVGKGGAPANHKEAASDQAAEALNVSDWA